MRWNMVLPILFSLVVGHLFAVRPVRAEENFPALLSQVKPETAKPETVKPETVKRMYDLTTGAEIATYPNGHTLTITPRREWAQEPNYDTFFGVRFPKDENANCVGAYEQSQNAILDRARAYNAAVAHNNALIRAAQIKADAQQNRGRGIQQRINVKY